MEKKILLYLNWKKCNESATREKLNTETQADGRKKPKSDELHLLYITNEQLEFVGDEDTTLKIMKKFDQMYLKESTALQICSRNRIDRMKLKDFDDSATFFTEFEKLINELKSAGAKVSEQEKLDYMLKTPPNSISYVGDLIDSIQEGDRTREFLKNKITMWEKQSPSDSGKKKSSVSKTGKKDIQCFGCGKNGHLKKNCRNTWQGENSGGAQWSGGAR